MPSCCHGVILVVLIDADAMAAGVALQKKGENGSYP